MEYGQQAVIFLKQDHERIRGNRVLLGSSDGSVLYETVLDTKTKWWCLFKEGIESRKKLRLSF